MPCGANAGGTTRPRSLPLTYQPAATVPEHPKPAPHTLLTCQGIHIQLVGAVQVLVHQHRALRVHLHRSVDLQPAGGAGRVQV